MKSNKTLWLLAVLLVFSLFLAACAGDGTGDDDTGTDEDPDAGEEAGDGEGDADEDLDADVDADGDHIVLAVSSDAVSLDPHGDNDVPSSNVRSNIFETLVKQDDDMEIVEGLATDWEQIDDTTWAFTLQEGVEFHDGSEFTASSVKANLERVKDPALASPRDFLYEMIEEISVEGDHEVHITTEYPFAPLLSHLAHDAGGMISEEAINSDYEQALEEADVDLSVEEYYDLRTEGGEEYEEVYGEISEYVGTHVASNPYGTGFFELEERITGEETTLVRFEDYWGENALPGAVTFKEVPEIGARLAELETGYAHIADPIQPTDYERVDEDEETFVNEQESVSLSYVSFNVEREPFDDPKVREAINLAIDQEAIIEGIYEGIGTPALGPLAPDVFGYDENVSGLGYDPERAQELLDEAGYGDGFETTIWTNDDEQRVEIATYVQDALSEFDIDVEINQLEWGTYLDRTADGEHDMFILGWSTVTADADYGLYALFHSSAHGSTGNRSFIADDELDELLDQGRREADPDARQEIYTEAQELLTDLAPMLYVHHQNYITGVRSEVEGFSVDALGIYQLKDITLNE
ncbi:glutathione ABC transporter substrate-binding protein [Alkalibacillus silvisoli]|uniref:Glutathione ABC transporter substrate-binding protein n=1 Tax=Alkalibacillus silvisoli TaxID=392823 RepID=A0ABN1A3P9_9BACI